MKKKLIIFCLMLTGIVSSRVHAQMAGWTITQGGGGTIPANTCQSIYGGGSLSMSLRLKDASGTDRTSSAWFYENNNGFSPDIGCVSYPMLRTPSCTTTVTPYNYGTTTISAYYGGPAGGGGTLAATVAVNIWPSTLVTIPGSITSVPSAGIGFSQTFSMITGSTAPMLPSTTATWSLSSGYLSTTYYSLSAASGPTTIVTPQPLASLNGDGYRLNAGFSNVSSCYGFVGQTANLARTPQIKVISGAPGNILCGTAILQGNVGVNPATGGPGGQLSSLVHQKDCLLQWNWYKSGSPTPIGPANVPTLTVTTPGTYYMAVTQYNNINLGSFWGYDMAHPIVTKNSNSITLVAPVAGTITPNFKINGFTPGTTSTVPYVFSTCPAPTFTFNGATSTGPINNYTITINRLFPTTGLTATLSAVGLPPSSLDISSYVAIPGTYSIALSLSNGCSVPVTYTGYIKISTTPTNKVNINYTQYTSGSAEAKTCKFDNGTGLARSWANPQHVGRWTTAFAQDISASFINGSPACTYQAWAYAGDAVANPSLPAVCSTTVTTLNCSTPLSTTSIPLTQFWATPYVPYFGNPSIVTNLSEYTIKIRLTNPCGYTDSFKYIKIHDVDAFGNGYYKPGENNVADVPKANIIQFTPMPFKQELIAHLNLEDAANTSLTIMTADGRVLCNSWTNENIDKGTTQKAINTANWMPGIYFYKLLVNGEIFTGKLVKY